MKGRLEVFLVFLTFYDIFTKLLIAVNMYTITIQIHI